MLIIYFYIVIFSKALLNCYHRRLCCKTVENIHINYESTSMNAKIYMTNENFLKCNLSKYCHMLSSYCKLIE